MKTLDIKGRKIELVKGDITREQVDAIANAANSALRGGGGVDGAIHRAGGPEIMKELQQYNGCPTGSAVCTSAGNLKARYVFHAVGPVFSGKESDATLLSSAYRACLELAIEHQVRSLALPSISTGIYGYPLQKAAPIALMTVKSFLESNDFPQLVRFVLFDDITFAAYAEALSDLHST